MATEYTVGAGFIVLLAVAIFLFSKYWERWQSDVVAKVFVAFDADSSGSIKQEELWAGVLQFYGKHARTPILEAIMHTHAIRSLPLDRLSPFHRSHPAAAEHPGGSSQSRRRDRAHAQHGP